MPRWYKLLWSTVGGLFVVVAVAYYLGAGGIRSGGIRMAFDQDVPQQLFRIDDTRAFLVVRGQISVVRYERANPLLYPCGCYVLAGAIANGVDRQSGPWVYTSHPGGPRYGADAVNLDTDELITVDGKLGDPAAVQRLASRGLDVAPAHALAPGAIAANHDRLWLRRESCMDWLLAFYAIFILLALLGPFVMLKAFRARSSR